MLKGAVQLSIYSPGGPEACIGASGSRFIASKSRRFTSFVFAFGGSRSKAVLFQLPTPEGWKAE